MLTRLITISALLASAAFASGQACAPFHIQDNRIVIDVRVNGFGPYRMLLDTGAAMTVIDTQTAALVRLNATSTSVQVRTVGQVQLRATLAKADTVTMASQGVRGLVVVVMPVRVTNADGILGQDFLRHFDVTIRNAQQCIALSPAS